MKTRTFDSVAMKRPGSRWVYECIKNMTPAQELAYWRQRTARLDQRIKAARRKAGKGA